MPFVYQAVKELRGKLKMSQPEFASALESIAEGMGIERFTCSPSIVSKMETGDAEHVSMRRVDALYALAKANGIDYLTFYRIPEIGEF